MEQNRSPHDGRRKEGILSKALADMTKDMLADALAWSGGVQQKACRILGCNKVYLWDKIKDFELDLQAIREQAEAGTWIYRTFPEGAPWAEASADLLPEEW